MMNAPIPWENVENATGFRLPTYTQFTFVLQSRYRSGTAWKHVKSIGEIGGDYEAPKSSEFQRPLFSLIPNRLGMFVNDNKCGTWLAGTDATVSARVGNKSIVPGMIRGMNIYDVGLFLVQDRVKDDL